MFFEISGGAISATNTDKAQNFKPNVIFHQVS